MVVIVTALTISAFVKVRDVIGTRVIAIVIISSASVSASATSSIAVLMSSSVVVLAITELLEFGLECGHRKEVLFGSEYAAKASKRANSDAQSLETAGGGPVRPLRRSSLEGMFDCSEAVRVSWNQIPTILVMMPFSYLA
ncbi:hypothetical protein PIB30_075133 [Stylosanthes scabra]|uniref:Uncharacterized protein n=1 Tax=Stylosanthes scabra TaxID=79078 RepID=A0ABU6TRX2_9FABA|nr:hypothetical protein [Stylosanthes scabra]